MMNNDFFDFEGLPLVMELSDWIETIESENYGYINKGEYRSPYKRRRDGPRSIGGEGEPPCQRRKVEPYTYYCLRTLLDDIACLIATIKKNKENNMCMMSYSHQPMPTIMPSPAAIMPFQHFQQPFSIAMPHSLCPQPTIHPYNNHQQQPVVMPNGQLRGVDNQSVSGFRRNILSNFSLY